MDLRNASLSGSSELFPKDAVEKSSWVLHDETIYKAIALKKPAKKSTKKLQFSKLAWQSKTLKHPGSQPSRPASEKETPSACTFGSKTPSSCGRHRREEKFWISFASLSAAGGSYYKAALEVSCCRTDHWRMEVLRSRYLIPFHHLSPVSREPFVFPSYHSRAVKAQALEGEVDKMLEKGTGLRAVDRPGPGY